MNIKEIAGGGAIAIAVLAVGIMVYFGSCTSFYENRRVAEYGGTMTIDLPVDQKFVNCTWKLGSSEANLWYITRPFREGETAEIWTFHEKSKRGIREGTVIFKERKTPQKPLEKPIKEI